MVDISVTQKEGSRMLDIINVKQFSGGIEKAIKYIHGIWGNDENYMFYHDAIVHSSDSEKMLPKFYLLLKGKEIIGCYGLIINDFISRHDLYPWLACLYIEERERGKELGKLLLEHGEKEAIRCEFSTLYLTTDHDGYYEKYGWQRIEDGYDLKGARSRIYKSVLSG